MSLSAKLYWVDGPWPGKLAMAARPKGGDWLADEVTGWKSLSVNIVLSLLTIQEEQELDIRGEGAAVRAQGLQFLSFPIPDMQVPASESELASELEVVDRALNAGKNVLVHCRQGIGRTGLVAACLLVSRGINPEAAVRKIGAARGVTIPETEAQRNWIEHYAAVLPGRK